MLIRGAAAWGGPGFFFEALSCTDVFYAVLNKTQREIKFEIYGDNGPASHPSTNLAGFIINSLTNTVHNINCITLSLDSVCITGRGQENKESNLEILFGAVASEST